MRPLCLKLLLLSYMSFFIVLPVQAVLDLELTKGVDSGIPIAVLPFVSQDQQRVSPLDISKVIAQDLAHSGRFSLLELQGQNQLSSSQGIDIAYWRSKQVEHVVTGSLQPIGSDQYKVTYTLFDLYQDQQTTQAERKNHVLITQEVVVNSKDLRRLAHHISDMIYEALTGEKGIFSTCIAYVLVQQTPGQAPHYLLEVADMDGYNPRPVLRSNEPIMSPSWSPDGKKMAYVSFENKRPRVYVADLLTGKRQMVTSFPGINGAPAWSPDSRQLALALSEGLNPNLYILDIGTNKITQVTRDSAINTEPRWAPDARSIIFTSDRGGTPQIYRLYLSDKKIERVTFDGNYNTTASFSPDGRHLVFLHRTDQGFNIATMDMHNNNLQVLTRNGFEESPSFAPNGRMIVYATQYGGRGVLGIVSTDGRIRLRLPDQNGHVQEPVWSPFTQ